MQMDVADMRRLGISEEKQERKEKNVRIFRVSYRLYEGT